MLPEFSVPTVTYGVEASFGCVRLHVMTRDRMKRQISRTSSKALFDRGQKITVQRDCILKDKLHRDLDHAIVAGLQSVVSADVVGDLPNVRGGERNVSAGLSGGGRGARSEGVQMVGKIEGFRAHLNRLLFPNGEGSR